MSLLSQQYCTIRVLGFKEPGIFLGLGFGGRDSQFGSRLWG